MNPGYEDNFKVFKLRLENRPRRQEVDSLGEAIVDNGGGCSDIAE